MAKDEKTGSTLNVTLGNLQNLRWWQATIMIAVILLCAAFAASQGANVTVNVDLANRVAVLEKTLQTTVNSSFYALQKQACFILGKVGSYYTLQNGSNGGLWKYSTNASYVINTAIAAAVSNGTIHAKTALYLLTASILIGNRSLVFEGEGEGTIFKLANNARTDIFQISDWDLLTDRHTLVLRDFSIDGNKANNPAGGALYNGIYGNAPLSCELSITGIHIKNTSGFAIYGVWSLTFISHNYIDDSCNFGVWLSGSDQHIAHNDLGSGLSLFSIKNCYVEDNAIFSAPNNSTYFIQGLNIRYCQNVFVRQNLIINNRRGGILIETMGSTDAHMNYIIEGNIITNNGITNPDPGIKIQGGSASYPTSNLIIENNIVTHDTRDQYYGSDQTYGLTVSGYIRNMTVANNMFINNTLGQVYTLGATLSGVQWRDNLGFVTENSFSGANTTATTAVINHGLASTATSVWVSFSTSAITGYTWTSSATQVTITPTGVLPASWTCYVRAEYKP